MQLMKFFRIGLVAACLLTWAPGVTSQEDSDLISDTFSAYATLLDQHVVEKNLDDGGLVSAFQYEAALKREETSELLSSQRQALARFDLDEIDSRDKAIAFWVNAYNFFMIAHILEERPDGELVDSVWDYGGRINPFRKNVFERKLFDVDGRQYSLDNIEKDILLGEAYRGRGWFDARVHFAVNCAAVGCPPLRGTVYTAGNVDALMTENTRRAFNTPRHLHVEDETLHLTSLFKWYEEDFTREERTVRAYIRQYADENVKEKMGKTRDIRYIDYDWNLNSPENFPEFQ